MAAGAGMLGRVAVGRTIAAERDTALLTRPQMDPPGADFHALLALALLGVLDGGNRSDMHTRRVGHRQLPSLSACHPRQLRIVSSVRQLMRCEGRGFEPV